MVAAVPVAALMMLGMASPAVASVAARSSSTPMAAGHAAAASGPAAASATVPVSPKSKHVAALCALPTKKGQVQCLSERRTDIVPHKGFLALDAVPGYGPADLASAYDLPANGGASQTVAIVDAYDDPNAEADLATYRAQYGLPACTTANGCFRKVDENGGTSYPLPNANWAGEISLDLDMVSAVAPQAHILLVEANDNTMDNLGAAVNEAVSLGAKYVSNSYGGSEDPTDTAADSQYFNHPGVAITVSSGDAGYGVEYPAASQYVTSVGGTSLTKASNARGWTESVWSTDSIHGTGSGCSAYDPKPSWQTDSGCSNRTVADVSAVADPATGVAVYDSYQLGGWNVFGGTSVSAPIIASVYADAGTPAANTYPSSYPYAGTTALNDVTTGSTATCTPAYLCTAGPGYDGPTGLGTPNGVAAFSTGPHGTVTGTVTNSSTNAPVAGATVTVGGTTAVTNASGHYSAYVAAGTYTATATDYWYSTGTVNGVAVTGGGSVTENFALSPLPTSTVSGTVTDGSAHNWPLYATVTADGIPDGQPAYTNPYTGKYSLTLLQGQAYTLDVNANYPGYQPVTQTVTVGTSDITANISDPIDVYACTAPGYTPGDVGTTQTFDGTSVPAGWTLSNTPTGAWAFNDPSGKGNLTGGSGGFAEAYSPKHVSAGYDMSLISPVTDFSNTANPELTFNTEFSLFLNKADVDVSTDGGTTWQNVWSGHSTEPLQEVVRLPLPMAAHQSAVQVRFHFTGPWGNTWWQVDNAFLGNRTCDPAPGGLVAGTVTDANTSKLVDGVTVTSADNPADNGTTSPLPDDPNLSDGFYWMFSSLTGTHNFTAAKRNYVTATVPVNVAADAVTQAPVSLQAGKITVTPVTAMTVPWQGTASQVVTVKNTGGAPATVTLGEQVGGSTPMMSAAGAPTQLVKGTYSPLSMHNKDGSVRKATSAKPDVSAPADAPWTPIANYPTSIQDNGAVSLGGKIYSAFGFDGNEDVASLYAYDPTAGTWSQLASATDVREAPAMAVLDGKIYATGGWGSTGAPDGNTEVYDPATNAWTTAAPNPNPLAGSGVAVLGGKMYVVGGCEKFSCGSTDVMVYDPATNTWSQDANYPEQASWGSCGAISGLLYCTGGYSGGSVRHTYVYDPNADSWSQAADLPIDLWGSGYTTAGGKLIVSGGITRNSAALTNQGFSYDPASDTWTPIPNSNNTLFRGGSACGLYKIGGVYQDEFGDQTPVASSEVLPGMIDCGETNDVDWLSLNPATLTLAPGASATVTVTVNANVPDITQPGTYTAAAVIGTDTPYAPQTVPVSMTVSPPKTWGKITGTVTGPSGPLAYATIQVQGKAADYTVSTDASGHYQLWLDVANDPLQVICADSGYVPQSATVKIKKGTTTTQDFSLQKL
jgi:N-acetylneuraminic acid mutarotase